MTLLYADTSALVRAYFADEVGHERLRRLLLEGDEPVVTSEVARLEFTSATMAAARGRRLSDTATILDRFDADCGDDGPLALIRLEAHRVLPEARRLLRAHRLRTLDALHLAVALVELPDLVVDDGAAFVTEDADQAVAAVAAGLAPPG